MFVCFTRMKGNLMSEKVVKSNQEDDPISSFLASKFHELEYDAKNKKNYEEILSEIQELCGFLENLVTAKKLLKELTDKAMANKSP